MSLGRVLQAGYGSRLAISGDDSQYTLSYDTATKIIGTEGVNVAGKSSDSCISITRFDVFGGQIWGSTTGDS